MIAEAIARALGGKRTGHQYLCRCPVPGHGKGRGDRNPSLSIADGDKGLVVYCKAGCNQLDVLAALKNYGGPSPGSPAFSNNRPELTAAQKTAYARRIFDAASQATGTQVERYLGGRGITLPMPPRLHFATLKHGPSGRILGCMVALVTDHKDHVLGIHRTFLENNAKAPVDPVKMMLGPCRGGAVRLAPAAAELMVAEGIESALSVMQVTGRPAWAALSAPGLGALVLPEEVHNITILADGDDPGEEFALRAADRWLAEGRRVRIARPPGGMDFNDLLLRKVS